MLVLNAVQFKGNDRRFRSSSRSLKMMSRCSSATKSILCTKQKIFASGEFWGWKCHQMRFCWVRVMFWMEIPCKWPPSMIDSNAYRYPILGSPHRIHRLRPQHFGKCCLFVTQNIVPWNSLDHHNPIDSALQFTKIRKHSNEIVNFILKSFHMVCGLT